MNIGGFLPLSLCDYPGKVAAVVFTNGCNFRCPWCHNGHLLTQPSDQNYREVPTNTVLNRLDELKDRLSGVVVTGGEPTLQTDLKDFLTRIKELRLLVKLDTNGGRPNVVRDLIESKLLDYIAMDVKAPWAKYPILTGITLPENVERVRETMRLITESNIPHQFRTTRVTPLLTEDDCYEIQRQIPAGEKIKWQTFQPEHTLDPALRS